MKRPACPKCRGLLMPDIDIHNITRSIGCINCGYRAFRGLQLRKPTRIETGETMLKGIPGKRKEEFRHV